VPACPKPGGSFDVDSKHRELEQLRRKVARPGLWNDPDRATRLTRRLGAVERLVTRVESLQTELEDAEMLADLAVRDSAAFAELANVAKGAQPAAS